MDLWISGIMFVLVSVNGCQWFGCGCLAVLVIPD